MKFLSLSLFCFRVQASQKFVYILYVTEVIVSHQYWKFVKCFNFLSSFLSLLVSLLLPFPSRCSGLVLQLITSRHTNTLGRIPLDEGSACRRKLYLTTHNTYNRDVYKWPPIGFETSSDPMQDHTLNWASPHPRNESLNFYSKIH